MLAAVLEPPILRSFGDGLASSSSGFEHGAPPQALGPRCALTAAQALLIEERRRAAVLRRRLNIKTADPATAVDVEVDEASMGGSNTWKGGRG